MIQPLGNPASKLWVIGERPASQDLMRRIYFSAGAGTVLFGMLGEVGISQPSCYFDMMYNSGIDDLTHAGELSNMMALYKPNLVILLGNACLKYFCSKDGIKKWRGSILSHRRVKVLPTYLPEDVMKMYDLRPEMIFDIRKAKTESKFPEIRNEYNDKLKINPTFVEIMELLEFLKHQEYVTFDIETDMKRKFRHKFADIHPITCIGFGWSKEDACCIPFFYAGRDSWTFDEEWKIIHKMRELFLTKSVKFIAQNGQFDIIYLDFIYDIKIPYLYMDTMLAQHCVYPELPKSLAFLTSIYTKRPYHKDMGAMPGADSTWTYNCLDCVTTYESAMMIKKDAKEYGTWEFYREHTHKIIPVLMKMQLRGVKINLSVRKILDESFAKAASAMEKRIQEVVGKPLNINSPKQMVDFLYNDLKLPKVMMPVIRKGKKVKAVSANTKALEQLNARFPNPLFKLIIQTRKVKKQLSTYIRAHLNYDNRIRCAYAIDGTDTGRLASRKSVFETGTNLQNITRGKLIRQLFIADEGMKIVNSDLSQAEARIVAYESEDTHLIDLFNSGSDIHKQQAARIFKVDFDRVTYDMRNAAKKTVHACNYRIGKRTLAEDLGITELKAHGLINQYFLLYPKVRIWHMGIEAELRKTRTLSTVFGRKRTFFGRFNDDLLRAAVAFIPQSTVSDLINYGIRRMYDNLPQGWELLMQVHDSIMLQVPVETDNMQIYKFCTHYLVNKLRINNREFSIPVDVEVGMNWGNLEKINGKAV